MYIFIIIVGENNAIINKMVHVISVDYLNLARKCFQIYETCWYINPNAVYGSFELQE